MSQMSVDGKTLTGFEQLPPIHITDVPFVNNDGYYFEAPAVDENGNNYVVKWDTTPEWRLDMKNGDCFSDDYACEWDNPCSVKSM